MLSMLFNKLQQNSLNKIVQKLQRVVPYASLKIQQRSLSDESASFGYKKVKKEEKQNKGKN